MSVTSTNRPQEPTPIPPKKSPSSEGKKMNPIISTLNVFKENVSVGIRNLFHKIRHAFVNGLPSSFKKVKASWEKIMKSKPEYRKVPEKTPKQNLSPQGKTKLFSRGIPSQYKPIK